MAYNEGVALGWHVTAPAGRKSAHLGIKARRPGTVLASRLHAVLNDMCNRHADGVCARAVGVKPGNVAFLPARRIAQRYHREFAGNQHAVSRP